MGYLSKAPRAVLLLRAELTAPEKKPRRKRQGIPDQRTFSVLPMALSGPGFVLDASAPSPSLSSILACPSQHINHTDVK